MTDCVYCGEPIPGGRVVRGAKLPVPTKFCSLKCNAKMDSAKARFKNAMAPKLAKALGQLTEHDLGAGITDEYSCDWVDACNLLNEYYLGPVYPAQKEGG